MRKIIAGEMIFEVDDCIFEAMESVLMAMYRMSRKGRECTQNTKVNWSDQQFLKMPCPNCGRIEGQYVRFSGPTADDRSIKCPNCGYETGKYSCGNDAYTEWVYAKKDCGVCCPFIKKACDRCCPFRK